ncbi:hypothetical protein SLEP1_g60529, partial [Rubroshorea leprosula]
IGKRFPSWMVNDVNSSGSSFLLDNMVELELINCYECTCIPSLGLLPSLKVLYIVRMENVRRMGHELQLDGAESIRLFPALKTLIVRGMKRLEEWVEVVEDVAAGSQGVIVFPSLKKLLIFDCPLLKTWSTGGFSSHHKLSELWIEQCSNLMAIPGLDGLSALKKFQLRSCNGLTSLPIGLGSCICLQSLEIKGCHGLTSLPSCISLWLLQIEDCPNLNSIPSINGLTSLKRLNLFGCHGLTCLPIGLDSCNSPPQLTIIRCSNLISIFDYNGILRSINVLTIINCENLRRIQTGLGCCSSLQKLEIKDCPNLISIAEDIGKLHSLSSIHTGLGYSISLQKLEIEFCPNLISIPDGIEKLCSLSVLRIADCENIRS